MRAIRNLFLRLGFWLLPLALLCPAADAQESETARTHTDLRVELRAPVMVMLSAPVAGRLAEIRVKDGNSIRKGDLLVQIDDRLPVLRLAAAAAARDQAATQLRLAERLHQLGSRGALDVEMAQAQLRGAEAERKMAQEMVNLCKVIAPWDGWVTQLEAKENQHVPEGAPLLEAASAGPMEVEFMMPTAWLAFLQPGAVFTVQVDEAAACPAELVRLGGKVDPLTQSIRAYGRLTGDTQGLLPGMTGTVLPPASR